ncbi:bifunctional DNA primase/polymerase [Streptomyces sp. NPDC047014]|uniref:bifunctional DNA primase/polymerase n=1 Tax=Streptomyces sp. NPDC047014 TaxID=3155736 RepID=UPI0033C6F1DD
MGFTIGGSRGTREFRSGTRRRGRTSSECTAVAEYTGLWGWDVVPGATGAHPLAFAPTVAAGATLDEVTRTWERCPGAAILLPVGRSFDVIEVAEEAGRRALVRLERMGLPLGPVLVTAEGRTQFFVAPGAAAELPQLLYRMGWDDADLDLRALGQGCYVTAPSSDRPGLGQAGWLRPPTLDSAGRPPQARLLLGTLAYICHRFRR